MLSYQIAKICSTRNDVCSFDIGISLVLGDLLGWRIFSSKERDLLKAFDSSRPRLLRYAALENDICSFDIGITLVPVGLLNWRWMTSIFIPPEDAQMTQRTNGTQMSFEQGRANESPPFHRMNLQNDLRGISIFGEIKYTQKERERIIHSHFVAK
ncbi:hypothetical protein CEXT_543361 [Caerostris extrusa]|uniref:Uncharacterized protein n=1 Tax=Caerostris extrusa TaxID=172846 RepID=A0AAV4VQD1_CAEEX|nr:hypothetical protein CEXT_543361 [Caerostris extrusa]